MTASIRPSAGAFPQLQRKRHTNSAGADLRPDLFTNHFSGPSTKLPRKETPTAALRSKDRQALMRNPCTREHVDLGGHTLQPALRFDLFPEEDMITRARREEEEPRFESAGSRGHLPVSSQNTSLAWTIGQSSRLGFALHEIVGNNKRLH
jgi:hypothetical protein